MQEAQRFLRYVTPGLVFATSVVGLIWVVLPSETLAALTALADLGGAAIVGGLLGTGGVGFILSTLHHALHWSGGPPVDHRASLEALMEGGVLRVQTAEGGLFLAPGDLSPEAAWSLSTALWHQRLDSKRFGNAEGRAGSLLDLVHALGTARVAVVAATLLALVVCLWILVGMAVSGSEVSMMTWLRLFLAGVLGLGAALTFGSGYKRTCLLATAVIDQVLMDGLVEESSLGEDPVVAYVTLPGPVGQRPQRIAKLDEGSARSIRVRPTRGSNFTY